MAQRLGQKASGATGRGFKPSRHRQHLKFYTANYIPNLPIFENFGPSVQILFAKTFLEFNRQAADSNPSIGYVLIQFIPRSFYRKIIPRRLYQKIHQPAKNGRVGPTHKPQK